MTSNIDPTKPETGLATTQSVRDNFQAAKTEIEALQVNTAGPANALAYGFKASDAPATQAAALQAALDVNGAVYVAPGDYDITGTKVFLKAGQKLTVDGTIAGRIATPWTAVHEVARVSGAGAATAADVTLFGDFTGFLVDEWLVVRIPDGSGGNQAINQGGWSFHKVTIAGTNTQVGIGAPGLRYSYPSYTVQKLAGVTKWTGVPVQGSREIVDAGLAADLIAQGFVVDDVVRLENATGTDTPWAMLGENPGIPGGLANKSYYEYHVIEILDATKVVFKDSIAYAHVDPWFCRMDFISGIEVRGSGNVQQVQFDYVRDVSIQEINSANLSVTNAYHVKFGEVACQREDLGQVDSRTLGFSFVRHLNVTAATASGARWITDNAAIKALGCIDYTFNGVQAWNTQITSGGSALIPLFLDFYFTPYSGFCQNGIIQGAQLGRPYGGAGISFWASGVRDVWIDNVIAARQFRISHSSRVRLSNVQAGNFSFEDSRNGIFARGLQFDYSVVNNVDLFVGEQMVSYGTGGSNGNHCFEVLGNTGTVRLSDYHNLSALAADDTYFVSNTTLSILEDCSDVVCTTSVRTGSSPGVIERRGCRFFGTQTVSNAQLGEWQLTGDLFMRGSNFGGSRVRMSNTYLFTGATGELRVLVGSAPTSATDGSPVTTSASLGTMATQNANAVAITGGTITGITDLAVADGGTGASTAPAARTNLGLVIGTDVQAFDTDLLAIAGLTSAADQLPYATGAGTWAMTTLTATARTLLDDTTTSAMRTTLGLAIGSDVQAFDTDLQAIAALTSAADQAPYATGAGTWAMTTVTAAARTVLDDTTVAAMRTTLLAYAAAGGDLGGLVTQSAGNGVVIGGTALVGGVYAGGVSTPTIQAQAAGGVGLGAFRAGASASPPIFGLFKTRGASASAHTAVSTSDQLGAFSFGGSDGTAYRDGLRLVATVTGAPTSTNVPTRFDALTGDGTSSFTGLGQDQNGNLQVNQVNVVTQARSVMLRPYTIATLPSAAVANQMAAVTDGLVNKRLVISDGTIWRYADGTAA